MKMNRNKLFLTVLFILVFGNLSNAQEYEEITNQYITNHSFESDQINTLQCIKENADGLRGYALNQPTGWTVEGADVKKLLITKDCYTDNNFGITTTISHGDNAYYLRMGWETGSTTVKQTVKNLPSGNYLLTVDQRTGYANSATSTFSINVDNESISENFLQGSKDFFVTQKWETDSLIFKINNNKDVNIEFNVNWMSGGSCIMIDNIRLYKKSGDIIENPDPTENDVTSPTEGVINHDFVNEYEMKNDLLQMLANFSLWMNRNPNILMNWTLP